MAVKILMQQLNWNQSNVTEKSLASSMALSNFVLNITGENEDFIEDEDLRKMLNKAGDEAFQTFKRAVLTAREVLPPEKVASLEAWLLMHGIQI